MKKEYMQPQIEVVVFSAHEAVAYGDNIQDVGAITPPAIS